MVTHIAIHMLNIEGASLSEQLLRLHAHMNGLSACLNFSRKLNVFVHVLGGLLPECSVGNRSGDSSSLSTHSTLLFVCYSSYRSTTKGRLLEDHVHSAHCTLCSETTCTRVNGMPQKGHRITCCLHSVLEQHQQLQFILAQSNLK